jgi:predicted transcriptional regulator
VGKKQHLAELQMAIMQVLWDREEATVAEVREALLPNRQLAYTTVGTMLTKMENNGQVDHRSDGRVNIYRPSIGPGQVKRTMISDLAARLFSGSVTDVVCHLLDGRPVSREELDELRKLIRDKEKELDGES